MTIEETLKTVQFVVDGKGKRRAVLLDIQTWERLINWIETLTDTEIAIQTLQELQNSGGRPEGAEWLAWDEISEEWSEQEEDETNPKEI